MVEILAIVDVTSPSFWATIGNGAIMGVAAALVGWAGNGIGKENKFDLKETGGKIVVGAFVGIVCAIQGKQIDPANAGDLFLGGSAVLGASKLGKVAWENVLKGVVGKFVGATK